MKFNIMLYTRAGRMIGRIIDQTIRAGRAPTERAASSIDVSSNLKEPMHRMNVIGDAAMPASTDIPSSVYRFHGTTPVSSRIAEVM